jgi:predicted TPR repeat methyltransferase
MTSRMNAALATPATADESERAFEGGCLVCGGSYGSSRRLPGLLACRECGFVSANLSLSDAEIKALYDNGYFHGNEYLDYIAEEESLRQNFRARLRTLRQLVPDIAERDLFEIGCAYGFFLDEARAVARSAAGMDISEDAVCYAQRTFGVDAHPGSYVDLEPGRRFGVIAMWDTIEHLGRPDQFIEKASNDLEPGGVLALTTGDIGSLNARLRGTNWRMIHPPTHLHYFSEKTITALLDRHGFDVVHLSHPGISRNLRSILYYLLVWRTKRTRWYDTLKGWRVFNLRVNVNMFDIMYVIARRR